MIIHSQNFRNNSPTGMNKIPNNVSKKKSAVNIQTEIFERYTNEKLRQAETKEENTFYNQ